MAKLLIRLWWQSGESRFLKLMKWKIKFIELKNSVCRLYVCCVFFRLFFSLYSPFAKLFAKIWKRRNPKSCFMFAEMMMCLRCWEERIPQSFWAFGDVFTGGKNVVDKQQVKMCECQISLIYDFVVGNITHISRQFAAICRTHTAPARRTTHRTIRTSGGS